MSDIVFSKPCFIDETMVVIMRPRILICQSSKVGNKVAFVMFAAGNMEDYSQIPWSSYSFTIRGYKKRKKDN